MGDAANVVGLFDKKAAVESYPLESRQTEELVIGMIGPVASGVSFTASIIESQLKSNYKYDGKIIKVSRFIEQNSSKVGGDPVQPNDPKRTEKLQVIGSAIRRKLGPKYLVDKCIEEINMGRGSASSAADPRRHVTILDSLKNKNEIERLREVYGENFVLFGVFAPESIRKKRLSTQGLSEVDPIGWAECGPI